MDENWNDIAAQQILNRRTDEQIDAQTIRPFRSIKNDETS